MDSKNTYLKNIIREEVNRIKEFTEPKPITPTKPTKPTTTPTKPTKPTTPVKSPFKTVQSSNHFRKWIADNKYAEGKKLGITLYGSKDDPKIINVFEKWKKEYWKDTNDLLKTRKANKAANQKAAQQTKDGEAGGWVGSLGFTVPQMILAGAGVAVAWILGRGLWKGGKWLSKTFKASRLTDDQAMKIASNPKEFQKNIDKLKNANPKALKKELQTVNPDEVLTDSDVIALQKALGNPRLTVDLLIQARRKVLQSFKDAIATGKLPKYKADQVINTLTPAERVKYAPYIRSLYAKAQKKKQFKAKVKRTWNKFRSNLPYGD